MSAKYRILFLLLTIFTVKSFSQSPLFINNDSCKFFLGTQEPDTNWRTLNYNDNAWQLDTGRIGYGEYFINTLIPKTTSVYLRIKFFVKNKKAVHSLDLRTDFNDGFVAYLNGTEIIRTNLGKPGEFIPYNRITDRSHKQHFGRNYFRPVDGYYIDSSLVNHILVNDTNILAVQVHNDMINGPDLSFLCTVYNVTGHQYDVYRDPISYLRQIQLDSTLFPIINITTDSIGVANHQTECIGKMVVINNSNGKCNKPTDKPTEYNGRIKIGLHGQSSADFPKKTYGIETEDSLGNNYDVPLLGQPKNNDWILSAQFADKSLIRNELAFYMGRRLGHYETRTKYCEVIMDGEFLGTFILTERIKRDSDRVHIAKLTASDISGDNLTGGYIVKIDKPSSSFQYVYPKLEDLMPQQKNYIDTYFSNFLATLNSSTFLDPQLGFKKYIDTQSLVDYMIAEEAMKNCDAYAASTFMYKDKITNDGRIKFGPLWDHDIAFGGSIFQNGCEASGWQYETNTNLGISKILRDTAVVHQFQNSWAKARQGFLKTDSMLAKMDSLIKFIETERKRNYKIWPVINGTLFYPCNDDTSYEQNIAIFKSWLTLRLSWIDNNITKLYYPITNVSSFTADNNSFEIYPNPFNNNLKIKFHLISTGNYSFNLFDIYGRKLSSSENIKGYQGDNEYGFDNGTISNLSKGIYFVTVIESGNIVHQTKLIKE